MDAFPDLKNKSAELAAMAKALAKEKNIGYVEALLQIGREHPALVTDAYEDVLGRVVRSTTVGWPGHQYTITDIKDAGQRLSEMAKTRAREKNIPFATALSGVSREFPNLTQAHRQAVLRKKV